MYRFKQIALSLLIFSLVMAPVACAKESEKKKVEVKTEVKELTRLEQLLNAHSELLKKRELYLNAIKALEESILKTVGQIQERNWEENQVKKKVEEEVKKVEDKKTKKK